MDAARVMTLLRPQLEATGARWMLAGGLALVAWGSTRTTADTDVLVDDAVRHVLLERLRQEGFDDQPTRVFRDGEDLRVLLSLPDLDENAVRATFERAGLGELYSRLKAPS